MKTKTNFFFISLATLLCGCTVSARDDSVIESYNIFYDEFALRSSVRPNPPTTEKRFLVAIKQKHKAIEHVKRRSPKLNEIFLRVKKEGCNLGKVRDNVAVYIVGESIYASPLLIYKEGLISYNNNLCSINKTESDMLLKDLGFTAYWISK